MVVRSKLLMMLAASAVVGTFACQGESSDEGGGTDAGASGGGSGGSGPEGGDTGGNGVIAGEDGNGGGGSGGEGQNDGGDEPPVAGEGGGGGDTGGGGDPGTGGEPGGGTIPIGDVCDPTDDQCVSGAGCADFGLGKGPLCYATCDTVLRDGGEPSGCAPDEACVDFEQCDEGAETCIGLCLPSDRCEPCNPDACGGPHSCLAVTPATLCLTAGTLEAGAACLPAEQDPTLPESNCQEGLVCAYGECAQACGSETCGGGGTCAEGEVCADFGFKANGDAFAFCHKNCAMGSQEGCGENEVCFPLDNGQVGEDVIVLTACGEGADGEKTHGDPCTQDASSYFGDCTAGNLCADVFHASDDPAYAPMCNGLCDAQDQSACGGASGCYFGLFRLEGLGICIGQCDPFGDAAECGENKKCELLTVGVGAEGEMLLGLCNDAPAGEPKATGEDCTVDEDTGASDCAAGHLCIEVAAGEPPVCIAVCDNGEGSEHTCPAGFTCMTDTLGSQDNRSQRFGLCAPQQQ